MAGAGGFEPPVTGPKPVALPLGYAPLQSEYSRFLGTQRRSMSSIKRRSAAIATRMTTAKTLATAHRDRDDDSDRLGCGQDPGHIAQALEARPPRNEGVEGDGGGRQGQYLEPPEPSPDDEKALDETDEEREAKPPLAKPVPTTALAGLDSGELITPGDVTRRPQRPRPSPA